MFHQPVIPVFIQSLLVNAVAPTTAVRHYSTTSNSVLLCREPCQLIYSASTSAILFTMSPLSVCPLSSLLWWQDFMIMLVHHLATIMLITFSYGNNMIRAGTLVMCLHDASDIFLEVKNLMLEIFFFLWHLLQEENIRGFWVWHIGKQNGGTCYRERMSCAGSYLHYLSNRTKHTFISTQWQGVITEEV